MMLAFPQYDSYRDSGVPWIGKIPSHWEVKRHIGLFDERNVRNRPEAQLLSVTIEHGVIPQTEITTKKDSSNDDKSYYKWVEQGDLAYNKMRMWQGAVGMSEYDGIVSPAYVILRPRDRTYSKFFHYLFRTPDFICEADRHSYGIVRDQNSLRYDQFKTIYSPVPPKADMLRIVAFLDEKTREIDDAIAKKRRLIELLQEQKAILINEAVTKGLNPDVPLKESGVEWIGRIPAHWQVKKLKYSANIFRGKFTHRPRNDPRLYDGDYPFIQTGDVARSGKFITEYRQTLNEKGLRVSTLIPSGTVVITIAANIGDIAILGFDACFPDSVVGFRPHSIIGRDFLYYALSSMKNQFIGSTTQNTQMNLNVDSVGSNLLAVPPRVEQLAIVKKAEQLETSTLETVDLLKVEISTLGELRRVLIAEAVTGKIRV